MIKLEFETAIFLYLLVAICGFLFFWLFLARTKYPSRSSVQQDESIWHCPICTYIYVDSKNKQLSLCPRCGSYNERTKESNEVQANPAELKPMDLRRTVRSNS